MKKKSAASPQRLLGPGDDAELISQPMKWPRWPLLPLKKRSADGMGLGEIGVLYADDIDKPVVHLINLWEVTSTEALAKAQKKSYASIDALLADGWIVD